YDPTKGRKDIRYYPVSETKLLELSEEESMEISSLPCDEDQLLSFSPTKSQEEKASYSPRRSPRLLMNAAIQISPKKKLVSHKEPQEPRQVGARSLTCSQGKRLPRKEPQRVQVDARSQACSQGKDHQEKSLKEGRWMLVLRLVVKERDSPGKRSHRNLSDQTES
ncbi:MAG: hypothetical protein AB2708_11050, partial [Candidatus Thiodiazotropha taylori]